MNVQDLIAKMSKTQISNKGRYDLRPRKQKQKPTQKQKGCTCQCHNKIDKMNEIKNNLSHLKK